MCARVRARMRAHVARRARAAQWRFPRFEFSGAGGRERPPSLAGGRAGDERRHRGDDVRCERGRHACGALRLSAALACPASTRLPAGHPAPLRRPLSAAGRGHAAGHFPIIPLSGLAPGASQRDSVQAKHQGQPASFGNRIHLRHPGGSPGPPLPAKSRIVEPLPKTESSSP
jgi:hypothetical protein